MALIYPDRFVESVSRLYRDTPAPDLARDNQFRLGAILCEGAAENEERRCLYTQWLRIVVSEAERIPASKRSWDPPVKAKADVQFQEETGSPEVGLQRG